MPTQNSFNEQMEREAQDGSEWLLGAVPVDLALVPLKDRMLWTPLGVLQYNNVMDTNGCASRGPNNILETKLNYFYDHGMHPAIKRWCDEKGYRKDGSFALSDNFLEILSGTTRQGNSLKAPVDALRLYGAIPAHMLTLEPNMTWEEYMNPKRVTQEMLDLGKEFLKRLTINYEKVFVSEFLRYLEKDLIDVAGAAWPQPVNGVYPRHEASFNHAFATVNPEIDALDNYEPFTKRLAKDFKFFEWGYTLSITRQTPYPEIVLTMFEILQKKGLLAYFADWLKRFTANVKGLWS